MYLSRNKNVSASTKEFIINQHSAVYLFTFLIASVWHHQLSSQLDESEEKYFKMISLNE